MGYKVKKIYQGSNLVRPKSSSFEFYYDFRGGSLAGFQAAGGGGVWTNGSYTIDANGLGQTSSSNDRQTTVYVPIDVTNAKYAEVEMLGNWIANPWSNNKGVGFGAVTDSDNLRNPARNIEGSYNTTSPGSYNGAYIGKWDDSGNKTNLAGVGGVAFSGGDMTSKLAVNLETGEVIGTHSGANNYTWTYTMSSSEISDFKSKMKYAGPSRGRGYSTYNGERVKTLYIKIT